MGSEIFINRLCIRNPVRIVSNSINSWLCDSCSFLWRKWAWLENSRPILRNNLFNTASKGAQRKWMGMYMYTRVVNEHPVWHFNEFIRFETTGRARRYGREDRQ